MPRRYKFTKHVDFTPANLNPSLIDDTDEPEQFNYGVYFNDGYDYMKHLISMDDFNDPSKVLPLSDKSRYKKDVTVPVINVSVLKEVEIHGADDSIIDKLKVQHTDKVDEDVLKALNGYVDDNKIDDDSEEVLDDYFNAIVKNEGESEQISDSEDIDMGSLNIKSDSDIMRKFLSGIHFKNTEEKVSVFDEFMASLKHETDQISDLTEKDQNKIPFRYCDETKNELVNVIPEASEEHFRMMFKKEKRQKLAGNLTAEDLAALRRTLCDEETEYVEADMEAATAAWIGQKVNCKVDPMLDPMSKLSSKKVRAGPKMIVVEGPITRRRRHLESSATDERGADSAESGSVFLHKPRDRQETVEQKKDRKREIKQAKRLRIQERKQNQHLFSIGAKK